MAEGIEQILPVFAELWGEPFALTETRTVLGALPWAGSPRPLPSSMARVEWGDGQSFWLPAPLPDNDGPAPLFLQSGHVHVMPIVRLLIEDDASERNGGEERES